MKFTRSIFLLFCVGLLFGAVVVRAQPAPASLLARTVDADDTPLVQDDDFPQIAVRLTPLDAAGLPVTGLAAEHFQVAEDGVPIPAPPTVSSGPDPAQPVSVLLLLDLGHPLRADWEEIRTAVPALYTQLEQTDESGLLAFSRLPQGSTLNLEDPFPQFNADYEHPFTNDEGALINLVNSLNLSPDAGSPLYDALVKGVRLTAVTGQHTPRALILLSDGQDDGSNLATQTIALQEVMTHQVPVFVIAVGEQNDDAFLQQIAAESGGQWQRAADGLEIEAALSAIVDRLKTSYRLQYQSALPADDALHELTITAVTGAGEASLPLNLRARYPLRPQIAEMRVRLPRQSQPVALSALASVKGTVVLTPQILSRQEIDSVNYYLDGGQQAIGSAGEAPWQFTWDTTALAPGQMHDLYVQVLTKGEPVQLGESQYRILVEACPWFCQMEQTTGLTPAFLALTAVALVVVLLLLRQARRPATAVPPPATPPQRTPLQATPTDPRDLFRSPAAAPAPKPDVARPPTPASAKTEVLTDPQAVAFLIDLDTGHEYRLEGLDVTIGHESYNDIVLLTAKSAPRHTKIMFLEGEYIARNLNTAYITKINGQDIRLRQTLKDGDRLEIGGQRFAFRKVT